MEVVQCQIRENDSRLFWTQKQKKHINPSERQSEGDGKEDGEGRGENEKIGLG